MTNYIIAQENVGIIDETTDKAQAFHIFEMMVDGSEGKAAFEIIKETDDGQKRAIKQHLPEPRIDTFLLW